MVSAPEPPVGESLADTMSLKLLFQSLTFDIAKSLTRSRRHVTSTRYLFGTTSGSPSLDYVITILDGYRGTWELTLNPVH